MSEPPSQIAEVRPGARRFSSGWVMASALLLAVVIVLAYRPSLDLPPRGDQWCFLLDTIDLGGFIELVQATYSYNRTRKVLPGDSALFRPALFGLLSLEKAIFGPCSVGWQLTGVIVHVLACLACLALMRSLVNWICRMRDPAALPTRHRWLLHVLAFSVVMFFGLNPNIVEAVVWSHLTGYILFYACVTSAMALLAATGPSEGAPSLQRRLHIASWAAAACGVFLFELGQVFAVLLGCVTALRLAVQRTGRRGAVPVAALALFCLLPVLYQGLNLADAVVHGEAFLIDPERHASSLGVSFSWLCRQAIRFGSYTTLCPLFPSCVSYRDCGERIEVPELDVLAQPVDDRWMVASWTVVGLSVLLCALGAFAVAATRDLVVGVASGSWILLYSGFALAMILGRLAVRDSLWALSGNSYYAYFPLLLACLFVFALTCAAHRYLERRPLGGPVVRGSIVLLSLLLLALAGRGGQRIHEVGRLFSHNYAMTTTVLRVVGAFVSSHAAESGFSLAFDYEHSAYVPVAPVGQGVPVTTIVFRRYMDDYDPLYVITFRAGGMDVARRKRGQQPGRSEADPLFCHLIRCEIGFQLWAHGGWYHAVPITGQVITPRTIGLDGSVRGKTVDETVKEWRRLRAQRPREPADRSGQGSLRDSFAPVQGR
ncbi:MAG: hypothetical protein HY815_27730 [Candidatus Riflebacteria bacterium]|nr:hypothetical protein [Candidatus Riflebacteria bacterium]